MKCYKRPKSREAPGPGRRETRLEKLQKRNDEALAEWIVRCCASHWGYSDEEIEYEVRAMQSVGMDTFVKLRPTFEDTEPLLRRRRRLAGGENGIREVIGISSFFTS